MWYGKLLSEMMPIGHSIAEWAFTLDERVQRGWKKPASVAGKHAASRNGWGRSWRKMRRRMKTSASDSAKEFLNCADSCNDDSDADCESARGGDEKRVRLPMVGGTGWSLAPRVRGEGTPVQPLWQMKKSHSGSHASLQV